MTPFYERNGITIFCGECSEVMSTFESDTFDLTVTSPPYDDLREYNGYVFEFEPIAQQLWRITSQGGVVVWVVADATVNGSETFTSFRQALYFRDVCGFNAHDTMIYRRHSMPSVAIMQKRYEQHFEYMFVFSKGYPNTCNHIKEKKKYIDTRKNFIGHRIGDSNYFRKNRAANLNNTKIKGNVWDVTATGGHNTKDKIAHSHPAIFPEALARDHIISWSNPGDLVLDPMCGSGTTLKMAQQLGRRAVGIDISEEYCKIAVERLRQPSFWSIPDEPKEVTGEQPDLFNRNV